MSATSLLLLAHTALLSALWIFYYGRMTMALRQVRLVRDVLAPAADRGAGALPSLTVVVTARDEEAEIETTVRGLLAQRYPDLQIVVVNDRSRDRTGAILDGIASEPAARGRLEVIHNGSKPEGWLGKCHACRIGAARARSAWILFKDGDVTLVGEDLLARIVRMAERQGLDHIALIPDMGPVSAMQSALVGAFGQAFLVLARAHEMDEDRPRGGAGIGAFNLMRRDAYLSVGGHERLRMDPGDDVKLGQLLKEAGYRQRIYSGLGLVLCPWQRGTAGVVRGLEKNAFSGVRYSVFLLASLSILVAWMTVGPLLNGIAGLVIGGAGAPPFVRAAAWAPFAIQQGIALLGWVLRGRIFGVSFAAALLYPLAVVLLGIAVWNSAIRTLRRGGISWRGDFYPLAGLREGLVRPGAGLGLGTGGRRRAGGPEEAAP